MSDKKLVVGLLAHVDAGKTTLAESILYTSGSIRRLGRVDHRDTFLDTDSQERDRGITIFSKQARLCWRDMEITLLDTPGHVDFSAEMERTLQVLDYAVLVISGADGVQGHVLTLWRLLERYHVPVFLFINKMDQPDTDEEALLEEVRSRLGEGCVAFGRRDAAFYDKIAVCDEEVLERYLEMETAEPPENDSITTAAVVTGNTEITGDTAIDDKTITSLILQRKVFPCYFGSALKVEGITGLLDGLYAYTQMPQYGEAFGARVYKIARDVQGVRLTYVKITGGTLKVKQTVLTHGRDRTRGEGKNDLRSNDRYTGHPNTVMEEINRHTGQSDTLTEEKIDQIRIYSGSKYTVEQEVSAGTVCALTGPAATYSGEGLGAEQENMIPLLAPVMTYRILLPDGCDAHRMFSKLCRLEEEEPQLHMVWKERLGEIHAQLMGEVQTEVLRNLIRERFDVEVTFDEGSIVYKETIADRVEGVGHFEPLRHYAEVHLLMEPGEPGSGLQFHTACSEDMLDRSWQRLILTHLEEKEHIGVLTGSPITDMKITLVAGRAHLKHTEGGDFRQATYRAVRQGLCQARNVLLEPVYSFRLELPAAMIGRAMTDMQNKAGKFDAPEIEGEYAVLKGTAPVSEMAGYQAEVSAYSGGMGRLFTELKGYEPCHNAEAVIASIGYEAERDVENPCSSVFCAHGAGFVVEWDRVADYMHLDSVLADKAFAPQEGGCAVPDYDGNMPRRGGFAGQTYDGNTADAGGGLPVGYGRIAGSSVHKEASVIDSIGQDEIDEIMNRTYGMRERKKQGWAKTIRAKQPQTAPQTAHGSDATDGARAYSDRHSHSRSFRGKDPLQGRAGAQQEEYLLVDGYNIIFAWDFLKELAQVSLDSARDRLMDVLSNFQGYRRMHLILVFDAYKVKGGPGSTVRYHNIDVVYTKEAETADQYIEKVTHEIGRKHRVRVATSDGLEQLIIMGAGAVRVSARELREEVMAADEELRQMFPDNPRRSADGRNYLMADASDEVTEYVERMKHGQDEALFQGDK